MNNIQSQNFARQMRYDSSKVSSAQTTCMIPQMIVGSGSKGEKGDIGEKGDKGDVGEKGDKGDVGEKGDKGDVGEKGDKGDVGEKGATGIAPKKASIVFKKNNNQIVNQTDSCNINGWNLSTSDKFTSDSVNIMILNKGLYYICVNINVEDFAATSNISFVCLNNKTNLPVENVSEAHINGSPLLKSTGIIHGIINVDSNLSFKIISNFVPQDSLKISDTCQITLIEI